ncbi:MAG TPA: ATP-binding protein [Xanthomonadales bacterium]|nr:ATP-binding protein [Xanthomonadales bacterium]
MANVAAHEIDAVYTPESYHVLILNSFNQDSEPYARIREEFMLELQAKVSTQPAFYQFDLQQRSNNLETSDSLRVELLRNQFRNEQPDLVVAIGPPAVNFWFNHRQEVFPQVPTLIASSEYMLKQFTLQPQDASVGNSWTFPEVVGNILQLLPDTQHILVVFGSSDNERRLAETARQSLLAHADRIDFIYSNDMSLRELQHQLSGMKQDSAVLFGIFDSDANGLVLSGDLGLAMVRSASPVPVFGFFAEQLGHGIVGGPLIPLTATAKEMAVSAFQLLSQGRADKAHRSLSMDPHTYDWRELEKWGIAPARLPQGSIVKFKPPTLWNEYSRWIVLAGALFLVQVFLIIDLLLQRRRRRRAEQANLSLTRRLFTAHEDEQRRIARELHDDLSQRLARLSIDAGYLVNNPTGDAVAEIARDMQPRLVSLGKDVHDMSMLLHPSVIDDLGIAAALASECERVQRHSEAEIVSHISPVNQAVPYDTSLAIFRIAQEALHNAVRHANATRIELSLVSDGNWLTLTVWDDGVGFETTREPEAVGLGMFSMRERASLVKGTLTVRSSPLEGTTITAVVPVNGGEP